VSGGYQEEDLVGDGWTEIIRNLVFMMKSDEAADLSPEGLARAMELADFMKMEQIRARVASIVEDPDTAEALKPYYRQFCKRPCFHDDYLPTFNRPNVTLVDTQGEGVERVTEKGVVVGGKEYELDCLIYATGFEVGTDYSRRAGYELVGRDDVTLTQKWEDGITTLHGIHIRGFPNCFMMSIAQSGLHHLERPRQGHPDARSHARSRGRVGRDHYPALESRPRVFPGLHTGLLQQRGEADGKEPPERLPFWRADGVRGSPRSLASRRWDEGAGAGLEVGWT
ncbi:MAG: hypothetical protein JRG89_25040, partial [Deltaproteobacteria bacterium]|nr:hypothetical protein [Deltaproteobacteria bacterium]